MFRYISLKSQPLKYFKNNCECNEIRLKQLRINIKPTNRFFANKVILGDNSSSQSIEKSYFIFNQQKITKKNIESVLPIEKRLASVTTSQNTENQSVPSARILKRKTKKQSENYKQFSKRLKPINETTLKSVEHQQNIDSSSSTKSSTKLFKVATRQQTRKLASICVPIDSQSIEDYTFTDQHENFTGGIGYDTDTVINRNHSNSGGIGRPLMYPISSSTNTMATLCNIGNTCYLNSVVYTLRFAPFFLHNLHHLVDDLLQIDQILCQNKVKSSSLGRNVGSLQGPNTRSWSTKDLASAGNSINNSLDIERAKRQIATEKLHELYHNLYCNEMSEITEAYHTDTFLNAVQDVSSIFSGNQQQDAHEFLMCVLDSIRDTSQRLTKFMADSPDIILKGLVNQPEKMDQQPIVQPTQQKTTNGLNFFRKRNKTTQQQQQQQNNKDNGIDTTTAIKLELAKKTAVDGLSINDKTANYTTAGDKQAAVNKMALDFFADDFEGITVSSTKCLSCETVTEQRETMIDLSVPITGYENMETIDNAQLFIQNLCITRENFRAENKYRCEECSGLTEAIRTVSYPKLPRLLIIQLKRFSGGMEKINSYIPTPFTLQCFCSDCMGAGNDDTAKRLHVYKLYSVITHVGATLSVGHYIAYTCSLGADSSINEYHNCPIVKRKHQQLLLHQQQQSAINSLNTNNSSSNINNSGGGSSGTNSEKNNSGVLKKIMFGRNKASSSGDVTKNVNLTKNANGLDRIVSGNNITTGSATTTGPTANINGIALNGIGSCQSVNCCSIYVKDSYNANNQSNSTSIIAGGSTAVGLTNGISDYGARNNNYSTTNSVGTNNAGSNSRSTSSSVSIINNCSTIGGTGNNIDPIWYMCDDDKIKAMTQREFEELLSPNSRKVMVTPYLLFYARTTNNNQQSASTSPAMSQHQ